MSTTKNVYERISAVMADLTYIQKTKELDLGGRRVKTIEYEMLAALVQPLLVKHGLVLLSSLDDLKVETIESEKPGYQGAPPKKVITTIATVKMRFCLQTTDSALAGGPHLDATDWLIFPGMGYDTSDKAVGKATTYAAKDFMRKVFVVPSGEEPEDDNHERPSRQRPANEDFPPAGPIGKPSTAAPHKAVSTATTPPAKAVNVTRADLEKLDLKGLANACAKTHGVPVVKQEVELLGGTLAEGADKSFGLRDDAVKALRETLIIRMTEGGN